MKRIFERKIESNFKSLIFQNRAISFIMLTISYLSNTMECVLFCKILMKINIYIQMSTIALMPGWHGGIMRWLSSMLTNEL